MPERIRDMFGDTINTLVETGLADGSVPQDANENTQILHATGVGWREVVSFPDTEKKRTFY